MLEQMRKQAQSAIVLLLFGFIIFVFVFSFGAGSVGFQTCDISQSNAAAIVNGETIAQSDYIFIYFQELQNLLYRRKDTERVTNDDKRQLANRAVEQLIDQQLLIQAARALGVRVTDEERNEDIRESPLFQHSSTKQFDFQRYKNIIEHHFRTTMAKYEEFHRKRMMARRMADIIQDTARVTDEELENDYRMRETKVDLELVRLSPSLFKAGIQPDDEQLGAFIEEHKNRVEEFYKRHEGRYHKPKKLQVAHVLFETQPDWGEDRVTDKQERAELTLDDLDKGADFAEQAKEYSEDARTREKGGDLGAMTMETMTARWGAPFAEAAFALKEGEISRVVKSNKGFHVIKCQQITPAVDRTLEEVSKEIARELIAEDQAVEQCKAMAARLLAGLKEGKSLEALVEKQQPATAKKDPDSPIAPTSLIRVRKTGPVARMGGYIPQLGADKNLARAVFALTEKKPFHDEVYQTTDPMGGESYLVFRLIERVEPDMSSFGEAKETLRSQLLSGRRQGQLVSWLEHKREAAEIERNQTLLSDPNPLTSRSPRQGR